MHPTHHLDGQDNYFLLLEHILEVEKKDLESLAEKLDKIEKMLTSYLPIDQTLANYDGIVRTYFRLIQLYLEYGKISPSVLSPEIKDGISKSIIELLFQMKRANVTQITDSLKNEYGTASRNTVRKRLKNLEEKGIIVMIPGNPTTYEISDEIVTRWLKMIGINIGNDSHIKV